MPFFCPVKSGQIQCHPRRSGTQIGIRMVYPSPSEMAAQHKTRALSAVQIRGVRNPGMYSGGGLYLRVDESGAKRWVQRVTIVGKRRNLGLGGYPAVSLADARQAALDNAKAIREGRDPLAEKREAAEVRNKPVTPTFAEAAETVIGMRRPTWSNDKHAYQWTQSLTTYAFPTIGNNLVSDIDSADILTVLTPIWTTKSETARRVRQRVATVLDWTIAQGYRVDNPAGKTILTVLSKVRRTKQHHLVLPYREVPSALIKVTQSTANAVTKLAFEFLVLTAARSGEVRLATWAEIDWDNRVWTVPAERMKARHEHRVPLSSRALVTLRGARDLSDQPSELLFPTRSGKPLSDMALTTLLRRLRIPAVPHGFRSSFKDWSMECSGTSWADQETALAHRLGDSTEAAYARSDLLEQRRPLMEAWASFLFTDIVGAHTEHLAA